MFVGEPCHWSWNIFHIYKIIFWSPSNNRFPRTFLQMKRNYVEMWTYQKLFNLVSIVLTEPLTSNMPFIFQFFKKIKWESVKVFSAWTILENQKVFLLFQNWCHKLGLVAQHLKQSNIFIHYLFIHLIFLWFFKINC